MYLTKYLFVIYNETVVMTYSLKQYNTKQQTKW